MAKILVTVQYEFDRDALEDAGWDEAEMRENYPEATAGVPVGLIPTSAAIMKMDNTDFVNNMEWLNDYSNAKLIKVEVVRS